MLQKTRFLAMLGMTKKGNVIPNEVRNLTTHAVKGKIPRYARNDNVGTIIPN